MNESNNLIDFSIKKVKEFSFTVDEVLFEESKQANIQFQHNTRFFEDTNLVDLTLRVYYSYDSNIPPDHILVDFHVQNIFEVPNLKQYSKNNIDFILPQHLIVSMVSVSISHTRSLMARNIAGSVYEENILPIINPVEVSKAFYPHMFIEGEQDIDNRPTIKKTKKRSK